MELIIPLRANHHTHQAAVGKVLQWAVCHVGLDGLPADEGTLKLPRPHVSIERLHVGGGLEGNEAIHH